MSDTPIETPAPARICRRSAASPASNRWARPIFIPSWPRDLAGGIGLSGGACGALGAAIWLIGLKSSEAGDGKISFNDPAASAVIEKFLESSDHEFECAKIVGRKFEDAADHAAYVGAGGCAKIIEALAACLPADRASDPIESGASS